METLADLCLVSHRQTSAILDFLCPDLVVPKPSQKTDRQNQKIPPTAGLKRTPEMMLPSFYREHGGQGSYWAVSPTGV